MKRIAIAGATMVVLCGCATTVEMWIPMDTATRVARLSRDVQFLDAPPDRPYTLIGIITPPDDMYETEAEAVADMKIYAAEHGADAIFIESRTETSGWSFDRWGGSGSTGIAYRAKAIVWKPETP